MIWWLLPFACIGAGMVAFILFLFAAEVIRALRQSKRVAAIAIRRSNMKRRRITCREWVWAFRREFFSSYDSLIIGFIEIPRNPSKPLRARIPGQRQREPTPEFVARGGLSTSLRRVGIEACEKRRDCIVCLDLPCPLPLKIIY